MLTGEAQLLRVTDRLVAGPKGRLFGIVKFAIPAKTQEVALQIDARTRRRCQLHCPQRPAELKAGSLRSLVELDGSDASGEA